jgi:hypothetical protein
MSESIKQRMNAVSDKSDAYQLRKLMEAVRSELVLARDLTAALKVVAGGIWTIANSNYLTTTPTLGIGSTPQNVASVAFDYSLAGVMYAKAAVAAGTAPGNDVIPQSLFGAVAFDIGSDGTIDAVEAPANATGYASAVLAAAALPAAATGHARLGYVTATKSDGAFTFGTTALNAANSTVAYTNSNSIFGAIAALDEINASDMSEYLAE